MNLYVSDVAVDGMSHYFVRHGGLLVVKRDGEAPFILMHHTELGKAEGNNIYDTNGNSDTNISIYGDLVEGRTFADLQENDTLLYLRDVPSSYYRMSEVIGAFHMQFYQNNSGLLLPFEAKSNALAIAAGFETSPCIFICDNKQKELVHQVAQILRKANAIYDKDNSYRTIMLKQGDSVKSMSLLSLLAIQDESLHSTLTALLLSFSAYVNSHNTLERLLELCQFDEPFSLLTQEEQVEAFIQFSKLVADQKEEMVPDSLLSAISSSKEYEQVKVKMEENGLGLSQTQQFNVLQQVGFFSDRRDQNILYNLSDMGAGKTLMTVEAIYLLDLKQISNWKQNLESTVPEDVTVTGITLPDKHIIAPTLSVKSSWIDTFKLFYEVTPTDNEFRYELSITFDGVTATSTIYVSPFTVKNGNIFAGGETLPGAFSGTYLIIDEIHQLVKKKIAKTKFFPSNTNPSDWYKIFVLSGTMSNMQTREWLNFIRFMGLPLSSYMTNSGALTNTECAKRAEERASALETSIRDAANNIQTEAHRYLDADNVCEDNYYDTPSMKQTAPEEYFFSLYGNQILKPKAHLLSDTGISVEELFSPDHRSFLLESAPNESDNINFELFYNLVGCRAVTAQSMQVAEELFGEQKTQHTSDIIKTISPLSKEDIELLKILHHIAEDYNQYKSLHIATAINNAILNLNDGLQKKNIYELVSEFADRNVRFLEYLASLDIDLLEQLPKSGLIQMPELQDTDKFKILKDILEREKDETHLIVVNDYTALKTLSEALDISYITKEQLANELNYQEVLDALFEKQSIVIVTQSMIKSSLDLVQANRLVQYQLNTEISDIIQTQNRINRIGQTRETRGYYIASDQLQENLIELFLESYRNIRVAHKGIVELFTDITSQINVVNDYLNQAFANMETDSEEEEEEEPWLLQPNPLPEGLDHKGVSNAVLYPQDGQVLVLVPLPDGKAFPLGTLNPNMDWVREVTAPQKILWNMETNKLEQAG